MRFSSPKIILLLCAIPVAVAIWLLSPSKDGVVAVKDGRATPPRPVAVASTSESTDSAERMESVLPAPAPDTVAIEATAAPSEHRRPDVETSTKEDVVAFEKLVDAYTDEKREAEFSKEEIAVFCKALDKLRGKDREVGLSQALDLLSDGRYELATAILFNPAAPLEDAEAVYHDLLNRPAEMKYPLLKQLAETENHPFAQDALELLEAAGVVE